MLVGGGATCPGCQQNDTTQLVSLIVRASEKKLAVDEYESLAEAREQGKAINWDKPRNDASWELLAKKLAAPPKPELPELARISRGMTRAIVFLVFVVFLVAYGLWGSYSLSLGPVIIPVLCIVGLVVFLALVRWWIYSMDANKNLQPRINAWSTANIKWHRLYYCARDDRVFVAGQRRLVAPEQLATVLYE